MTSVIEPAWPRLLLLLLLLQQPLPLLPLPRVKMRALVKLVNKFTTNKVCTSCQNYRND
jgi:hypothetical protein